MVKKDIVKETADKIEGATQKDIAVVLDKLLEVIGQNIVNGETVKLNGFGTFSTKERPARKGYNPQNGETIDIPASRAVKFRPATTLKTAVKGE
jgi:DNA-binding protein HU-beta